MLLLKDRVPVQILEEMVEYIDYDEGLEAWEFCAEYLYDNNVPITREWLDEFNNYRVSIYKKPLDRWQLLEELVVSH